MGLLKKAKMGIYRFIRIFRCNDVMGIMKPDAETVLDIGCQEMYFYNQLKEHYDVTLADCEPRNGHIVKENVENLSFDDSSFDIVICLQVLEHVPDPVKAMKELKRVARKQLIITVPNEPQFTFARMGTWEKEHLWAIQPKVFEHHLGKPDMFKTIIFNRYCLFAWDIGEE
ncbi:bifunctional 3-demethylubiquinone-9 3-methyltransferase/ 2-octaprenyl-6-hydroxy phenol methylase [Sedimentisphaera cyanobacteriorum]|uniref:Bifunctional 3-demethylubiquinone-9 3-methyltransferase/ 2-octaprenyl-6-hydroxy phenol methylase n=1 Tax=Sedimentisphaera cyanobacteriorum TaxID=1940790 RepID=A0A1Q2HR86_9BACT|nr:methyltransferase domain-containing protein [Sedimentisphaera cyanobacteriorum]AQQ09979.1 bifunctional 3-demethylubiquinone-9 3-methyltransferase/ 2-octaprenyl-6-hydroxy phenol methylase [Sedimentisphaera cyanobacteriorum]